jgi:hypothetical protein
MIPSIVPESKESDSIHPYQDELPERNNGGVLNAAVVAITSHERFSRLPG